MFVVQGLTASALFDFSLASPVSFALTCETYLPFFSPIISHNNLASDRVNSLSDMLNKP